MSIMVEAVGFEPTTLWLKARYSSQLSYASINWHPRKELNLHFFVRSEGYTPLYDRGKLVDSVGLEPTSHRLRAEYNCLYTKSLYKTGSAFFIFNIKF